MAFTKGVWTQKHLVFKRGLETQGQGSRDMRFDSLYGRWWDSHSSTGSLDDFMGTMPNLKTLPTGLKRGDHHQNVHYSLHVLWMPLLGSIPLRSHSAWAGLGDCHTALLQEQTQRSSAGPSLELYRADLSQSDCSSVVQASLLSVSCLTFVLSALNHLCKGCWSHTGPWSTCHASWQAAEGDWKRGMLHPSLERVERMTLGMTDLSASALCLAGHRIDPPHQGPALRVLACLCRLPTQPHDLTEERCHFFLASWETSPPLPFQASPISEPQHWLLPVFLGSVPIVKSWESLLVTSMEDSGFSALPAPLIWPCWIRRMLGWLAIDLCLQWALSIFSLRERSSGTGSRSSVPWRSQK